MSNLCIDLCSGLGGFSQAFVDAGWEVIRVDNDAKFKPDVLADVRSLVNDGWFTNLKPHVMLMSPPCQRFSIANLEWPKRGIMDALEIVGACLELAAILQPRYWVLENPKGKLRWFLGKPFATLNLKGLGYSTVKPTDLWGNIPIPLILDGGHSMKGHLTHPSGKGSLFATIRDPAERARLPLGLSRVILEAV